MANKVTATSWVGWVYFAAALLLILGGIQVIAGLVGIFNEDFYVKTAAGLIAFNYTTWGWIHLILGIIALATATGILAGATWARIVGVIVTAFSILGNIAFISAYPFWSIFAIVIGGFVIYALTMHGNEVAE